MPQAKKPLDVLTITRERLQEALDDAVRRGRMTSDDAAELLGAIIRRAVAAPVEAVRRVTDRSPLEDYDELTAAEVVARIGDLDAAGLRRVRDYERRNANRKTVLAAIEAKLD